MYWNSSLYNERIEVNSINSATYTCTFERMTHSHQLHLWNSILTYTSPVLLNGRDTCRSAKYIGAVHLSIVGFICRKRLQSTVNNYAVHTRIIKSMKGSTTLIRGKKRNSFYYEAAMYFLSVDQFVGSNIFRIKQLYRVYKIIHISSPRRGMMKTVIFTLSISRICKAAVY